MGAKLYGNFLLSSDFLKLYSYSKIKSLFFKRGVILMWSSNSTCKYTSKRPESRVFKRYLYTRVNSSIIHNSQNVEATQCPLTDEWISGTWSIGVLFSPLKRKAIRTHAATWKNLEIIMLRETSQSQDRYCIIPLTRNIQSNKIYRNGMMIPEVARREKGDWCSVCVEY